MTPEQFDNLGPTGKMYAVHKGVRKYVVICNLDERLFGLLPEEPKGEYDPWDLEWVRCENISEITKPQVITFS